MNLLEMTGLNIFQTVFMGLWLFLLIGLFFTAFYRKTLLLLGVILAQFVLFVWAVRDSDVNEYFEAFIFLMMFGSFFILLIGSLCAVDIERKYNWPRVIAFKFLILILIYITSILMGIFLPVLGILGHCIVLSYVIYQAVWFLYSRRTLTMEVVSVLESAVRQNLPIAHVVQLETQAASKELRVVYANINKWLLQGCDLADAVEFGFPRCFGFVVAAIRQGQTNNQLGRVLKSLKDELYDRFVLARKSSLLSFLYIAFLASVLSTVMLFLLWFILPKFEMIFSDSGAPREKMRIFLFMVDNGLTISLILLGLIFLCVPLWIFARNKTRKAENPGFLNSFFDIVRWGVPVVHWFEKRRSMMRVIPILRAGVASGVPFDRVVGSVCNTDVNVCYRRRLGRWHKLLTAGDDPVEAARICNVGAPVEWAMSYAANGGDLKQALKVTEKILIHSYTHAATVVQTVLFPLTILLVASLVAVFVYGFFSVYIELIKLAL